MQHKDKKDDLPLAVQGKQPDVSQGENTSAIPVDPNAPKVTLGEHKVEQTQLKAALHQYELKEITADHLRQQIQNEVFGLERDRAARVGDIVNKEISSLKKDENKGNVRQELVREKLLELGVDPVIVRLTVLVNIDRQQAQEEANITATENRAIDRESKTKNQVVPIKNSSLISDQEIQNAVEGMISDAITWRVQNRTSSVKFIKDVDLSSQEQKTNREKIEKLHKKIEGRLKKPLSEENHDKAIAKARAKLAAVMDATYKTRAEKFAAIKEAKEQLLLVTQEKEFEQIAQAICIASVPDIINAGKILKNKVDINETLRILDKAASLHIQKVSHDRHELEFFSGLTDIDLEVKLQSDDPKIKLAALKRFYEDLTEDGKPVLYYMRELIDMYNPNPAEALKEYLQNKSKWGEQYQFIDPHSAMYFYLLQRKEEILAASVMNAFTQIKPTLERNIDLIKNEKKGHSADPFIKKEYEVCARLIYQAIPALQRSDNKETEKVIGRLKTFIKDMMDGKQVEFEHPYYKLVDVNLLALLVPPPNKTFQLQEVAKVDTAPKFGRGKSLARPPRLQTEGTQSQLHLTDSPVTPIERDSKRGVTFGDATPPLGRPLSKSQPTRPSLLRQASRARTVSFDTPELDNKTSIGSKERRRTQATLDLEPKIVASKEFKKAATNPDSKFEPDEQTARFARAPAMDGYNAGIKWRAEHKQATPQEIDTAASTFGKTYGSRKQSLSRTSSTRSFKEKRPPGINAANVIALSEAGSQTGQETTPVTPAPETLSTQGPKVEVEADTQVHPFAPVAESPIHRQNIQRQNQDPNLAVANAATSGRTNPPKSLEVTPVETYLPSDDSKKQPAEPSSPVSSPTHRRGARRAAVGMWQPGLSTVGSVVDPKMVQQLQEEGRKTAGTKTAGTKSKP